LFFTNNIYIPVFKVDSRLIISLLIETDDYFIKCEFLYYGLNIRLVVQQQKIIQSTSTTIVPEPVLTAATSQYQHSVILKSVYYNILSQTCFNKQLHYLSNLQNALDIPTYDVSFLYGIQIIFLVCVCMISANL
jgi:hypothetical protein